MEWWHNTVGHYWCQVLFTVIAFRKNIWERTYSYVLWFIKYILSRHSYERTVCCGVFLISLFYLIYLSSDTSVLSIKIIPFHFLFGSCHQPCREYLFLKPLWQSKYFCLQPLKNPNLNFLFRKCLFLHSYTRYPDYHITGILSYV